MLKSPSLPKLAHSVVEFCRAAGDIGRTKFYEEVNSGRLKVRKIGSRTVVPVAEADAWLARLDGPAARQDEAA